MQLFSIISSAVLALSFPYRDQSVEQTIEFGHDPADSSIVRMRVTAPAPKGVDLSELSAVEIEFDRNGRERSRRSWPMKYPAWDTREPDDIDAEIIARNAEPAEAADAQKVVTAAMADAPESKFRRR